MSGLIFYNSYDIFCNPKNDRLMREIPGGLAFSSFFWIFSRNISAFDRTGVIKSPMNTELMPHMKLPVYDPSFGMSFTEVVDKRANEVMDAARSSNRKLAVMYSGGIDSTLILCSLLKNFSEAEIKERVVVLLSDYSVKENETFFYKFVSKKFNCVSSFRFPYFLGHPDYITITGENADQLFGSQANDQFAAFTSYESLFEPVEQHEENIIEWFRGRVSDERKQYAEPIHNLFKKMNAAAPIKIDNVYNYFWWINFSIKWQSVYVRILPFTQNKDTLKIGDNYTTFFYTDDFQQWAMNNTDKFVAPEPGPGSIKMPSKKYILDVNGDVEYMKKPKVGSLTKIVKQKEMSTTVDIDMNFRHGWPTPDMINIDNDFAEMMK